MTFNTIFFNQKSKKYFHHMICRNYSFFNPYIDVLNELIIDRKTLSYSRKLN